MARNWRMMSDDERIAFVVECREDGMTASEIGLEVGVATDTVHRWWMRAIAAGLIQRAQGRHRLQHTPTQINTLRDLAAAKLPTEQIARDLGVKSGTVVRWALAHGITLLTPAEARVAAVRTRYGDGPRNRRRRRAAPVDVPGWVPDTLRQEYERRARRQGEEAAASYARQAKRAMQEGLTHAV